MKKPTGRPKGSKNKAPIAFRERLRLYCQEAGVDPFEFLVNCLKKPKLENAHKINCAKELAKYLEPQLRSVEMELGAETRRAIVHRYGAGAKTNGHALPLIQECEDAAKN